MEVLPGYTVGQILEAFWTTIQLTVYSAIGALILGTALAAMRLAPVPVLNWIGTTYVNVVRNTPLTLIILFCSFGLVPDAGHHAGRFELPHVDRGQQLPAGCARIHRLHGVVRLRDRTFGGEHGSAGAGRGGPLTGADVRPEPANGSAAAGFSRGYHSAGSVLIALTKNTTIASAIGVAEAALLMKEMIENTAALRGRRDLRARASSS